MDGRIRGMIALLLLLAALRLPAVLTQPSAIDIETLGYPRLDQFDSGDGLPNLTIKSVSATDDGHIWAGTMRGLARFNGLRFVPVTLPGDDGHPDVISAVLAIDNRQVWVAPLNRERRGLASFQAGSGLSRIRRAPVARIQHPRRSKGICHHQKVWLRTGTESAGPNWR